VVVVGRRNPYTMGADVTGLAIKDSSGEIAVKVGSW
jgi:hypothetical protein